MRNLLWTFDIDAALIPAGNGLFEDNFVEYCQISVIIVRPYSGRNTGFARPSVRPSVQYGLPTRKQQSQRSAEQEYGNPECQFSVKKSKVSGRPHNMSALDRRIRMVLDF